ncbi:MAG TPA: hypothetical protein VE010_15700 [Thermoanaerobaculia bacterium]|nr:hypothetical protein [Thermoanaerobaculia bacterium]
MSFEIFSMGCAAAIRGQYRSGAETVPRWYGIHNPLKTRGISPLEGASGVRPKPTARRQFRSVAGTVAAPVSGPLAADGAFLQLLATLRFLVIAVLGRFVFRALRRPALIRAVFGHASSCPKCRKIGAGTATRGARFVREKTVFPVRYELLQRRRSRGKALAMYRSNKRWFT